MPCYTTVRTTITETGEVEVGWWFDDAVQSCRARLLSPPAAIA